MPSDLANPPSSLGRLSEKFRQSLNAQVSTEFGVVSSWIANMTARQLFSCFPDLVAAVRKFKPRVEAAQQAARERQQQEAQRQQEQAARPVNVLGTAYAAYVNVKRCYEARDGYVVGYISTTEMAEARVAVRQIEKAVKPKLDPDTTADYVWSRVEETEGRRFYPSREYSEGTRQLCRNRFSLLLRLLHEQVPESTTIEKDF
jgi:hypothetical protein